MRRTSFLAVVLMAAVTVPVPAHAVTVPVPAHAATGPVWGDCPPPPPDVDNDPRMRCTTVRVPLDHRRPPRLCPGQPLPA